MVDARPYDAVLGARCHGGAHREEEAPSPCHLKELLDKSSCTTQAFKSVKSHDERSHCSQRTRPLPPPLPTPLTGTLTIIVVRKITCALGTRVGLARGGMCVILDAAGEPRHVSRASGVWKTHSGDQGRSTVQCA